MASLSNPLLDLISSSSAVITAAYATAGLPFPDVNDPACPASLALSSRPDVLQAVQTLVAATSQLVASVQVPAIYGVEKGLSMHISHAILTAIESHAAEALRDAGLKGLHVKDIAEYSSIDASKLGRILRFLTSQYLFQEVQPDVFAATNLTHVIDTGKPAEVFKNEPRAAWYEGTNGLAALFAHTADEGFKSAAYLPEAFLSPKTASLIDPSGSGLARAFSTNKTYFEWIEAAGDEGQKERLARFGMAMLGTKALLSGNPEGILEGIGWEKLEKGSVVVDCGAGIGTQTLIVAKHFPDLKYYVQDRPEVIKQAEGWWKEQMPDAVASGCITLLAHDFMTPQPVKEAAIYFLRFVIHDWPDPIAIQILKFIRAACSPSSRLILVERVLLLGCNPSISNSPLGTIDTVKADFPAPLAANGGQVSFVTYAMDMQMAALLNAKERTLPMWREIVEAAGFKIERLSGATNGQGTCHIICAPGVINE